MDPYIRIALDRADARPRDLPPRRQRPAPRDAGYPLQRHLRELRQGRHDHRDRLGRRAGRLRVPRRTWSTWATRLRHDRLDRPFGGRAKLPWNLEWAAQWSLFGVTIEPLRQGPRDRRRVARPARRDRPRGLRARAAAQRRPTSSSTSAARRCRPPRAAARPRTPIAEVIPPEQLRFLFLRPRPNQAIEFDPEGPTRSRACSTSSTGSPPRPPAARSRASCRPATSAIFRYSPARPDGRRRPPRPPPSGRPSRTSRCCSRSRASTSPARDRGREGERR